ncbi:MAG: integrase arm-type DNA-binding domain-containing protein [Caldisericia bacterium]|nr:integrase arm-type DNA-binding domain-containing protein [Caldisericia bacterium]
MPNLTATQIKNAKTKDKPYTLSDGLGLTILIHPTKSKAWRYRFQFDGKSKMMSLGVYPDVSLSDARTKLMKARELVAQGVNPIEQKTEEEGGSILFSEVSKRFLESIKPNISTHHYERSESLLRLYATPKLQNHDMQNITDKMLQQIIVALVDAEKIPSAQKMHGVLNQLFAYAKLRNLVDTNVCRLVETTGLFDTAKKRNFPTITEPKKIKLLLENIRNFEGNHWSTKQGLLFMALTSLRSGNIRSAKWKYINFEDRTMTIPKAEMKINRKKLYEAHDFVLPLSTQAMVLLESIKPLSGHGTYIFPSIRGDRPMSENAMLTYIRSLGYTKEQFTPHGFRAMFATIANDKSNFDRDIIDAQLAHKIGNQVSQAYNRTTYLEKRRELVQWWADWIDSL